VSGQAQRRISLITSIVVVTGILAPGFADRAGFWCGVVAAVTLPVWLPAWVVMTVGQIKINMLHPDNVVEIPWQWRTALAKDPQAAQVAFAHEMSHARHGDTVIRRLLGHAAIWMIGLGWADTLGAASALASARPTTACLWLFSYLMLASPAAMVSIRRARRLLNTIHELRSDAEACPDEQSMWHMREIVTRAQRIAPSRTQTARLHALSHNWADPIAGQVLNTVIIMAYGCIVPVICALTLLWTGVNPRVPRGRLTMGFTSHRPAL
jgi:hypothetical protein